eukprot:6731975-Ditylum_brightwellii.AAC.1
MVVVVSDLDVEVAVVFGAAALASLALAKRLFPAQLIVTFVMVIVVCVIIVELAVEVITPVLVAAEIVSLALMKRPFATARHYIPFCLNL